MIACRVRDERREQEEQMRNFFGNNRATGFSGVTLLLATIALLSGCGNSTPEVAIPTSGKTVANTVQVLVSSQQVASFSGSTTDVTGIVLDANGQAVPDKVVIFKQGGDGSAYFTDVKGIADANGIVTATLNIGSDRSNRVITVTAEADTAIGSNTVTVSGSQIAMSGNTSLAIGASSTITIIVKDSTGAAISGVPVTVTSQNGNPIALIPADGITDVSGQITATVTANIAGTGTDVLTASGAGATQTQTININSSAFYFTAPIAAPPATVPEILVNTPTTISVNWSNNGTAVSLAAVNFTTSRGTITGANAVTDAAGNASATVTATSTGATILTAAGSGPNAPAATLNVVFVTASASTVTAQANPSTVAVNAPGKTSNQSLISVIVRDAALNLVKNARVNFSQFADPSGGSLASASAVTDITGTASVNYIAGTTSSGQNKVQINVEVSDISGVPVTPAGSVKTSVYLTVASQSLFVRLGTDNYVFFDSPVFGTYSKEYTALVTDAAGNNAPDGTQVRFALRPAHVPYYSFSKGWWDFQIDQWVQTVTVSCLDEDANRDGNLDLGEDINGNGFLEPSGVATVNATGTTVGGFAVARISYAKEYAKWTVMELEARAGTIGNDPPSIAVVPLPGADADYAGADKTPPGVISPFGRGDPAFGHAVCTDPY